MKGDADALLAAVGDPLRHRTIQIQRTAFGKRSINTAAWIEQSRDAIVLGTEDGLVIEWNRAAEVIYGLAKENVAGRPLWKSNIRPPARNTAPLPIWPRLQGLLQKFFTTGEYPQPSPHL